MLLSFVPVIFLLILLMLALLIQQITQTNAAYNARSSLALDQSARVRQSLEAANRSVTTYAATHHRRVLVEYFAAAKTMPAQLARLQQLASTPDLKARAARLALTIGRGMQVLDLYYRAQSTGNLAQAHAIEANPAVQRLGLQIQSDATAFDNAQRAVAIGHTNSVRDLAWRYEVALVACSLLGIIASLYMTVRFGFSIVSRLHRLANSAERLGRGEGTEAIEGNDEIAELDRVYQAMTRRIQREHAVASVLQSALLPQELPKVPGLSIDTAYVPAAEQADVGGDWYDVFVISQECVGISIGDVSGHGIHAAAVMGSARQAIRMAAYVDANPSAVFDKVNRLACAGPDKTVVTAFYATLDTTAGVLRYTVAGHPMPLVIGPSSDAAALPGQGLMLGVDARTVFETFEQRLGPGAGLLLYTDGLVEGQRDYLRGMEQLTKAFTAEYRRGGQHLAQALQQDLLSKGRRSDDTAILYVRIDELGITKVPVRFHWQFDARDATSSRRIRRALLWHLGSGTDDDARLAAAETVYGELVGNVARHTPGYAEMTLEMNDGQATIQICDRGEPFALKQTPPDILDEGGRGLLIVRALSHDVVVERNGQGNCVRAVVPIE